MMLIIEKTKGFLWSFFICVLVCILILPPIFVVSGSFARTTAVVQRLMPSILSEYARNTGIIVFFTMLSCLVVGFSAAYVMTFYNFAGKKLFEFLLILPFAIPSYIFAYIYADFFSYGGVLYHISSTLFGIPFHRDIMNIKGTVFVLSCAFYPYVYIIMRGYLKRLDKNMLRTAASLGASPVWALFKVVLPLSFPAVLAAALLIVMEVCNAFGTPSYFGVQVFSTGIYQAWIGYRDMTAMVLLSGMLLAGIAIFAGIVYMFKNSKKYHYSTGRINFVAPQHIRGGMAVAAQIYLSMLVSIAFVIPCLHLFFWLYRGFEHTMIEFSALIASLMIAGISAALIIGVSIVLADSIRYKHRLLWTLILRLATLGYGIPGVIIGIAVFSVSIGFDRMITGGLFFTLSIGPLFIAYVIRFVMLGYNSIDAGFNKLGLSFSKAARTLGAGKLKTLVFIELPLIKSNIIAGFLLSFIEILKDLPITALLLPVNWRTLAMTISNYAGQERLMSTAYPSLLIIMIAVLVLYGVVKNGEK